MCLRGALDSDGEWRNMIVQDAVSPAMRGLGDWRAAEYAMDRRRRWWRFLFLGS